MASEADQFLKDVAQIVISEIVEKKGEGKVVEFVHPRDLQDRLDLELTPEPCPRKDLLEMCKKVIRYSVKTGHPHFFNQLFGGLDSHGLAGAWLTDALNTSQYTYEVSPVFTLMEREIINSMLSLIGFPDGGDGIFCPGGSISNMYHMNLARYQRFPEVKRQGMRSLPQLCIFTSDKSHYSIKKGAALLGFGMDNVITVKTDNRGRIIPEELNKAIVDAKANGYTPLSVNATAGTTVLGAYDPLEEIAHVCQKHAVWMHVDAAWGGGVLLSDKLRDKMAGVERADSVTWNPHKMMGAPLQASAFLTRHKNLMAECHSANAQYLFQQDKFYDVTFDTGDKSIQCGRKVDALKLWLMWKARGTRAYAEDIENLFDCAGHLTQTLASTQGFRLVVQEPECTNVCFWYIPPSLRGQEETPEWWAKVGQIAPEIKQRMTEQGSMLIGYQPDGDLVNFFRMVVSNLEVSRQDMDFVVSEIVRLGQDL